MFNNLMTRLLNYLPRDQKGQDAAEYGLLIALVAIAIVAGASLLGGNIAAAFNSVAATIGAAV